jgi:catechol 2,3-dioxygenase-like lactoylglutathione lyase family enzyme
MANETGIPVLALKAHLAINVKNVEKSLKFYRKMLGIEPSKVRTGYAKFDVQNPPLNLTLNEVPFGERGALSHMGIQVRSTDDVFAVRKRWADQDLITRDEMQTNCCYARQDKTWVNDPDGNEWEVFVVLEDNLAEVATPGATCCAPVSVQEPVQNEAVAEASVKCGCETAAIPDGQPACCDTQAAVFGISPRA